MTWRRARTWPHSWPSSATPTSRWGTELAGQEAEKLPDTIDRLAFDSFLYGVAKSLEDLGEDRKPLQDDIGNLMLGYLIDSGRVEHPERPEEFEKALRALLTKSGFGPKVPIRFKGSLPAPSAEGFFEYLAPSGPPGRWAGSHREKGPAGIGKVDWVLYEMVLYGVTKALDNRLGAQAQLILDRIGAEMIDYLLQAKVVQPSDNEMVFFYRIKKYFMKAGFAKNGDFSIEGDPPRALVATWSYAPYYTNVLKRLHGEGSALFSCPVCLMGESILAKTQGLKFQNMAEVRFLPDAKVYYRHKVIPPSESFTEEDAERFSKLSA